MHHVDARKVARPLLNHFSVLSPHHTEMLCLCTAAAEVESAADHSMVIIKEIVGHSQTGLSITVSGGGVQRNRIPGMHRSTDAPSPVTANTVNQAAITSYHHSDCRQSTSHVYLMRLVKDDSVQRQLCLA